MRTPTISLTTDFGASYYVGQMHAVIARIAPHVRVVDLTHEIAPQNIIQASAILQDSIPHFPAGSIHIGVVDPGVGTRRAIIAAEVGDWFVIGPDNGLFAPLFSDWPIKQLVRLGDPSNWRRSGDFAGKLQSTVSCTFHGRDIMAPAACYLALGIPLAKLGTVDPSAAEFQPLQLALSHVQKGETNQIIGSILYNDRYGNLITNIRRQTLEEAFSLSREKAFPTGVRLRFPEPTGVTPQRSSPKDKPSVAAPQCIDIPFVSTYGDRPPGTLVALWGSSSRLEISLTCGDASATFGELLFGQSHAQVVLDC